MNLLTGCFLLFVGFAWGMLATRMLDAYVESTEDDE